MSNRIDVFKPTQDEWYGSFELNGWCNGVKNQMLVHVSFCGNISPLDRMPTFRVCAWGNDDFGLECDFSDEATAFNIFLQICGKEFVNQQDLKDLGFVSA